MEMKDASLSRHRLAQRVQLTCMSMEVCTLVAYRICCLVGVLVSLRCLTAPRLSSRGAGSSSPARGITIVNDQE